MQLTKLAIFAAIAVSCISANAFASWVFDPYAGYSQGKTNGHLKPAAGLPNGGDVGDSFSEVDVGLKLGLKSEGLGLWFAVDPELGFSGMSKDNSSGNSSAYNRTQIFADLGFDVSIFRLYAGYGLMNEQKASDSKQSGGVALKAGLEIKVLTDLALIAEYHSGTFQEVSTSTGTSQVSDAYDSLKQDRFLVGLSLPFGGFSERR